MKMLGPSRKCYENLLPENIALNRVILSWRQDPPFASKKHCKTAEKKEKQLLPYTGGRLSKNKERHASHSHYTWNLGSQQFPSCSKLHSISYDNPPHQWFKDNFLYYSIPVISNSLASTKASSALTYTVSLESFNLGKTTTARGVSGFCAVFSAAAENLIFMSLPS